MEEKNIEEVRTQQVEEQPKKRSTISGVIKTTGLIALGAIGAHEIMTKGGWTKATVKGIKSLVNRNKTVEIVEEEIYIPRENDRRDNNRGFNNRQFNKR